MTALAFLNTAAAVADPTRLRMLSALHGGPLSVGQLGSSVGITSSVATYHVHRLGDAGLVATERHGRTTLVHRIERRWAAIVRALDSTE
jgi:DNA-binding transcriptional ArsR family regulator